MCVCVCVGGGMDQRECGKKLIERGHSTWFGAQILTQLYIYSLYSIGGIEHLHAVFSPGHFGVAGCYAFFCGAVAAATQ